MSVLVNCSCGKQLRVRDEHLGKQIRCPECGTIQVAGGFPETRPGFGGTSAPSDDSADLSLVRFACDNCGKTMQAKAEYAGRQTRCPGCQSVVTIQGVPTSPSADTSGLRLPQYQKPRRPPVAQLQAYILGAILLLVVLAGVGAFFWLRPGGFADTSVTDLDLIPADAQVVISVRVADVWNKPLIQQILKSSPLFMAAARDLKGGGDQMGADGFERFTLVVQDGDNLLIWGAFQLNRPTDPGRFPTDLENRAVGRKIVTKSAGGKTYYLAQMQEFGMAGDETLAFCLYHPRLMVFGYEAEVVKVLERGKDVVKEGPMADVIKRAAGREPLVGGFALNREIMTGLADSLKTQIDEPCDAVADIQKILLIGAIEQNVDFEFSTMLPDAAKAEQIKKVMEAGKTKLSFMLGLARLGVPAPSSPSSKQPRSPSKRRQSARLTTRPK